MSLQMVFMRSIKMSWTTLASLNCSGSVRLAMSFHRASSYWRACQSKGELLA